MSPSRWRRSRVSRVRSKRRERCVSMTGNSTFFNARRGIRRPQLHSLGIPTLRTSRKPSVGARLAGNRGPSGECRLKQREAKPTAPVDRFSIQSRAKISRIGAPGGRTAVNSLPNWPPAAPELKRRAAATRLRWTHEVLPTNQIAPPHGVTDAHA